MLKRAALVGLIGLDVFLAATAIFGAIWVVPAQPAALLTGSPFSDYTIPALALGVVVGGCALAAAGLLLARRRAGLLLSITAGVAIIAFELVEIAVVGLDVWSHALGFGPSVAMERFGDLEGIPAPLGVPLPLWLQPFYIAIGLLIIALAVGLRPMAIAVGHANALPVVRSLTIACTVTSLVTGCLVVASLAGVLFGQRGLYESNATTLPSLLTQDVLTLFVAVPLLVGSMWSARRGSVRGLQLWMGTLFYIAYAYSFAVLGDRLAPLLLLYAAIVSMSLYCLVFLLLATDAQAMKARFSAHTPTALAGAFVAFMALALGGMWVVAIVGDVLSSTPPTRVQMVVWPLDLIVAFPALFWGGVFLWRRDPLGYVAGGIVLLKAAGEGLTLVVQTWATVLMGGPGDPLVPVYTIVGLGGLALLIAFLRSANVAPRSTPESLEAARRNGAVRSPVGV
jgi:hypothetical protein